MNVEKIKKMKSGKYKLELENGDKIITYDDVILENNLLFSKSIDYNLYKKISEETSYYDIYNKILKLISSKMRSRYEIEEYLKKNEVSIDDSKRIIDKLLSNGLINDLNYVKAFISDRIYLSNDGPNKIKEDLMKHKIDINIIEEEIKKYDDEIFIDKIKKIIDKKSKNSNKSFYMLKQKIYYDLLNLGYDSTSIYNLLNNMESNDSFTLEKEFEKVYKKNSKLNNYELKNKIRNKLYSKGYSIDDINRIIEKRIG